MRSVLRTDSPRRRRFVASGYAADRPSGLGLHRRSERGASLIETAIAIPVLLIVIFGIIEFGLLFRSELTMSNAVRDGGRAASAYGRAPEADYLVLRVLEHSLAPLDPEDIDRVVIFEAAGPESTLPAGCEVGSITGVCNHYTIADFYLPLDDVNGNPTGNFRCAGSSVDQAWCPVDREASLSGGVDYVGMHIQVTHDFVTGLFGGEKTLSDTIVFRIEVETL